MAIHSDRLVVVKHEPGRKSRLLILIVAATLTTFCLGYAIGFYVRNDNYQEQNRTVVEYAEQIAALKTEQFEHRQQINQLLSEQALQANAKADVVQTIGDLENEVLNLNRELQFYKGVMAPKDDTKGLQIREFKLNSTASDRRYEFRLLLAQVANNERYISGKADLRLVGDLNGEKREFSLGALSTDTQSNMKFKFRYFQEITGELMLPDGLIPERIYLNVDSTGKKKASIEAQYDWDRFMVKEGK